MPRAILLTLALLAGASILNLAVAWAGAAWIAPGSATSRFIATPRADGTFDAVTTRHRLGHTRLSRAHLESLGNYPNSGQIVEIEWNITGNEYSETRAGWPMRSWYCRNYAEVEMRDAGGATNVSKSGLRPIIGGIELTPFAMGGTAASWRALPYRPLWPGLIVNTAFYAGLLGALQLTPRRLRRHLRRRRHQCESCGYPIGASPVCTECGRPVNSRGLPSNS